jgi:hypothetical protein
MTHRNEFDATVMVDRVQYWIELVSGHTKHVVDALVDQISLEYLATGKPAQTSPSKA